MSSQGMLESRPETVGRPSSQLSKAEKLLRMSQNEIQKQFGIENFDPIIFLMKIAADEKIKPELRVHAASKAAPYVHSTLKSIEVGGDKDNPIQIEMTDSKNRLLSLLAGAADVIEHEALDNSHLDDEDAEMAPQDIEYTTRK